jgi:acyl-CoA reductase-like NAD-dependent aldehyde dehydrogenase
VELANGTPYGLSAYVCGGEAASRVGRRLRAGNVWIGGLPESLAGIPFGGVGASGYGRLGGAHGVRQFAWVRNLWSPDGPATAPDPSPIRS